MESMEFHESTNSMDSIENSMDSMDLFMESMEFHDSTKSMESIKKSMESMVSMESMDSIVSAR